MGIIEGSTIGVIKEDARSLDYLIGNLSFRSLWGARLPWPRSPVVKPKINNSECNRNGT